MPIPSNASKSRNKPTKPLIARETVSKFKAPKQNLYKLGDAQFVGLIDLGVSAKYADLVMRSFTTMPNAELWRALNIAASTIDRKVKANEILAPDQSERVLGLRRLLDQVKHMVAESGNTEGFNAEEWMATWLRQPNAGLAGRAPAEFLGTVTGQHMVSKLLLQMQTGAYA